MSNEWTATIDGDQLYQRRARDALPLLVRQAEAGETIEYGALARELEMPNARNLNYVLGAIGNSLKNLGETWDSAIPPIQCVVVSKRTGMPGEGVGWFLDLPEGFESFPLPRQREVMDRELSRVYGYGRWHAVLQALGLPYIKPDFAEATRKAAALGGGESDDHKALKEYVARTPDLLGLPLGCLGEVEACLPSGDTLDVSFRHGESWVAAEVKSSRSPESDVVRGIFQCVKYLAVMRAVQTAEGRERTARVVLVLEGTLSRSCLELKNLLGVDAMENVSASERCETG